MKYERFSELWDKYIGNTVNGFDMTEETKSALIEYSQGNTSRIDSVREFLRE